MRRIWTTLLLLLAMAAGGVAPADAATGDLPVPYSMLPAAILGGLPDANAPGTNDWSCKPSAAHPRPVVLVHGTAGNRSTNWQTYGPLLKNNGYCVFALTFGVLPSAPYPFSVIGGMGELRASAAELSAFVARVLAATGAQKVDLVGHSQGTLMPDYYVKYLGGAAQVANYISIAPMWHGSAVLGPFALAQAVFGIPADKFPLCTACGQGWPGSPFLNELRAGSGPAVAGVNYVNIMTRYDEAIVPYASGIEPGMTNILVQDGCALNFADHLQLVADQRTSVFVLNALDPAHARPIPCLLSLPFIGVLA